MSEEMNEEPYIYLYGKEHLPVDGRDILEDEIDELIAPHGEVTGGGLGEAGWNVDVGYVDLGKTQVVIKGILTALTNLEFTENVRFDVNGSRTDFFTLREGFS